LIVGIAVRPDALTVSLGDASPAENQLQAIATDGCGSTIDVTSKVTWTSADPNVVTVQAGQLAAVGPGTTTVTAKSGQLSGTATVTVP
jgi:uncharacterized protein YjdB